MGRRFIRFLLGILYVMLVAALLIIHIQGIAGQTERTLAILETLLLAFPSVVVLGIYVRMKEPGTQDTGQSDGREITSMEQLRERIKDSALTEREWEIAWLVYRGYTNGQIAEEYCIAESTVKKHTSHIYEKLQVSGRKEFKDRFKGMQKEEK